MGKNRKYYPNRAVLFCSTRTETGLPLVPSYSMNYILWGILARARDLYDVSVCHFVFLSNHFHMLLVVRNPAHVSSFMGYIKTESAHAINRMLDRPQRTVWQDGYDSPILLDAEKVEHYIKYIYLNPARADLTEHIGQYPGVSSWEMFKSGRHKETHRRLDRSSIKALSSPALSINEQRRLVSRYEELSGVSYEFVLEPDAWKECFPEELTSNKEEMIAEVVEEEEKLKTQRRIEKRGVPGATALRRLSMLKEHAPKKRGKRMICLSNDKQMRLAFIEFYKSLCDRAVRAYELWKKADFSIPIPAGLFAPRPPPLVSALYPL